MPSSVRQKALNGAVPRVGIIDAVKLDGQTPGFIESSLVIGCYPARLLDRLCEEGSGLASCTLLDMKSIASERTNSSGPALK